jgi:hypothetical protein
MLTEGDVRRIALSMPEAQEKAHFDRPDFRVGNRIFATLWPSGDRVVVKLSVADQAALVAMNPEIFSVNSWSHPGWTNVDLKRATRGQLRDVVQAAWRTVAPRRLVRSCTTTLR